MEMTFPHFALAHDSASRADHCALLATAIARQANSRTVRVVRRAEAGGYEVGSDAEQRLHYFACRGAQKVPVRGAFWSDFAPKQTSEQAVYQADSTYIKVREIEESATGEQFNHAGHGALRKS
jgi:hypothetical protein